MSDQMLERSLKFIILLLALTLLAILVIPFTAEAQVSIYRSVGINTTALATGSASNTLTISGSTATFSANVTHNMGVGMAIQYDSTGGAAAIDAICFIHARLTATTFTVKRANGSAPAPTSAYQSWSAFSAYTTLANWESGTENTGINAGVVNFDTGDRDITSATGNNENWFVACYFTGAATDGGGTGSSDGSTCAISGWTTSASNTIKIYTPYLTTEVGTSQRHLGFYSAKYYALNVTGANPCISVAAGADHIWFDGLQLYQSATGTSGRNCFTFASLSSTCNIKVSNCIIRGANATTPDTTSGIDVTATANTGTYYVWNNIFFDFDGDQTFRNGITFRPSGGATGTMYAYNNTFFRCRNGIEQKFTGGTVVAKNNVYQSNGLASADGYKGTFDAASNYNLSNLTSDAPGANSKNLTTVALQDTVNAQRVLLLRSTDTGAINAGTSLSADANLPFSDDIEFRPRPASWDMGADEYVVFNPKKIYRSVGNTTSAIAAGGSNALTIADSTASFASALPDTIGVGDVLQYDSDNNGSVDALCFITLRNSSTSFKVKTNVGGTATVTSAADQDWGIYRAYTTLSNWESTTENTGVTAALRDYDIEIRDMAANGEQWNVALYQRAAAGNATTRGWNTGIDTYLRFFVPSCTAEVGTSFRHAGVFSNTKAGITASSSPGISISANERYGRSRHVRVEGLQISNTATAAGNNSSGVTITEQTGGSAGDFRVEGCIIKAADLTSGSGGNHAGVFLNIQNASATTLHKAYIANNIIYGFRSSVGTPTIEAGVASATVGTGGTYYVYNNTVYDCEIGFNRNGTNAPTFITINNIYDGHQTAQDGWNGTFAAASNYNISNLTSDAPGANSKNLTVVAFVDSTNNDFHLAGGDAAAQNAGTSLAADANYPISNDVDYADRTGTWDIGADDPSATVSTCATLYPATATSNNRRRAIIQ